MDIIGDSSYFLSVDDIIKRIDLDGNGTIDIKEFISATINLKEVSSEGKMY